MSRKDASGAASSKQLHSAAPSSRDPCDEVPLAVEALVTEPWPSKLDEYGIPLPDLGDVDEWVRY